jgi:hypothetical protein
LIERHVDPVGMYLDFCHHCEEKRTQVFRIEMLPAGGKPRGARGEIDREEYLQRRNDIADR